MVLYLAMCNIAHTHTIVWCGEYILITQYNHWIWNIPTNHAHRICILFPTKRTPTSVYLWPDFSFDFVFVVDGYQIYTSLQQGTQFRVMVSQQQRPWVVLWYASDARRDTFICSAIIFIFAWIKCMHLRPNRLLSLALTFIWHETCECVEYLWNN